MEGDKELVEKSDNEFKLKLLTHRLEVMKFVVTGLILGVATFVSTCTFKQYELRIQSKTAESSNLKPYLDKYMDLIQKDSLRYDNALEMATFVHLTSTDEEIKKSWKEFRTYLEQRLTRYAFRRDTFQKSHAQPTRYLRQNTHAWNIFNRK